MAFLQLPFPSGICSCFSTRQRQLPSYPKLYVFSCMVNETTALTGKNGSEQSSVVRRSANYQPPIWKHEFLQSLASEFMDEEAYLRKMEMLKKEVKVMLHKKILDEEETSLKLQLELVDTVQRLGVSYHFENEIKQLLHNVNQRFHGTDQNMPWKKKSLYVTALEFRVLRQHGYFIPQEILMGFKDEIENLSACDSEEKARGMLALYEASFLAMEGESLLDEARNLAVKRLENYIKYSSNNEGIVSTMVKHALELPLHWRMSRLETRWFIDIYERRIDMNPILLELSKLDFNILQSKHQEDLKFVSSWWRSLRLSENLNFARDRLLPNFFLTVGLGFEPQFGCLRRMCTKLSLLLTTIDDVYDVYGTLDELELFTHAIERWDVDAVDKLPDYMKICFFAVHNTTNDMVFDVFKDQGVNVMQYFKKLWRDYCKALLMEARWYHTNHKPTFEEYLDNAWMTTAGPIILVHAYVFATKPIHKQALQNLTHYPDIIRYSSIIFRLTNDLVTSSDEMKRGDVLKSLQCYMNDTGASEDEALEYINGLIIETWKKMNQIGVLKPSGISQIALNLAKTCHIIYQHRDGFSVQDHEIKDRVLSLFVKPTHLD